MTRKLKPLELELEAEIQQALLSLPAPGEFASVGAMVARAAELLELANKTLAGNALVQLTATQLMKSEKRRGVPAICAQLDGTVVLQILYSEDSETPAVGAPINDKLPTLDQLREQARVLGIDVSDLGRQKLRIIERLSNPVSEEVPLSGNLSDETSRSHFAQVLLPRGAR